MIRILISILLIIGAGGVYYFLTDPIINNPRLVDAATQNVTGGIKALQKEKAALNQAIEDIQTLAGRARELEATYQTIEDEQIKRLDVFLPDSVDDLQLIVDVDTIAQKSGMQIKDVKVNTDPDRTTRTAVRTSSSANSTATTTTEKPKVAKVALSFTTIGTYSQVRSFLADLSRSLRVLDVTKLSVVTPASPTASTTALGASQLQYQIELVTYWLK